MCSSGNATDDPHDPGITSTSTGKSNGRRLPDATCYRFLPVQLESVRHRVAPVDKVPPLPYHYDDLEPYIDTETMQLHYNGCGLYFVDCL